MRKKAHQFIHQKPRAAKGNDYDCTNDSSSKERKLNHYFNQFLQLIRQTKVSNRALGHADWQSQICYPSWTQYPTHDDLKHAGLHGEGATVGAVFHPALDPVRGFDLNTPDAQIKYHQAPRRKIIPQGSKPTPK